MAQKEGRCVKKGHEEGMRKAVSLLEKFELPLGLLPLGNVREVGFDRNTGYMWIIQEKVVEHKFESISKLFIYDTEINGYIKKKKIEKLNGVREGEPVSQIEVDDSSTGKIHFKSREGGIVKTFPVEAFAAGQ
ncbi:hypothetical protein PVL29_015177 [Vitis rotundifolia]|uniref:Uncharacterized protein n=1 Tax=Vitis rotundifolia TaxID=103349 RepID=A0AA38ZCQ5_VITRO|nr:hypothetical protein PVL29_015177 [Vitis rotundifolia]